MFRFYEILLFFAVVLYAVYIVTCIAQLIGVLKITYQQINIGKEVNIGDLEIADLVFSYFSVENRPEHVFIISKIENGSYYCVEAEQEGTNISEHTFTPTSNMRFRRVI